MEGKRGSIACDYAHGPQQNKQNYRQDGGQHHYRKGYDYLQPQPHHMEQSIRRSPTRSRQPSLSPPRRINNFPKYPKSENQQYEETQGNYMRHVNSTQINEVAYENPNMNDPVNQYYENQNSSYDRNNTIKTTYEGDYYDNNETENAYYQIGDHLRSNIPAYEAIKPAYEELNQVVQDGNYFSIIEDQYSTDEGDSFDTPYTSCVPEETTDVMYGEPFDPASYSGQEVYDYEPEEQYEPSYCSASNIPAPPPLPGTGTAYRQRYQNYPQNMPKNPMTASCPILSNKIQNLKRKDIFQQVSKKINETVVELRNAGIGDKADQLKSSNPNLDYIKRYNSMGKPQQERIVQRAVQERPNYLSNNNGLQRKMSQHQQQQLQFYKQLIQQKHDQISNAPEANTRGLNRQVAQEVQVRYRSPSRISQRVSQQDIINSQNLVANGSFDHHSQYQNEAPGREGQTSSAQQINEVSRKKAEKQMTESFVQLQ